MSNPAIMIYVPFALNGQRNDIQVTRQTNQAVQDATLTDGFPNATMTPKASGGKAPNGKDFNGLFYLITLDMIHRQSGKQIQYDATYATNIGGYSKGSVLQSTDLTKSYISTVDNNLTDPDSSASSGWRVYSQPPLATSTTVGTVKIADNLTSNATDTALTANQGRILANMLTSEIDQQSIGGNILKWGSALITSRVTVDPNYVPTTIKFQTPFPNNCFQVVACHDDPIGSTAVFSVGNITKNGFDATSCKMKVNGEGQPITAVKETTTMRYFAIGN